jgi:hypothetical protein
MGVALDRAVVSTTVMAARPADASMSGVALPKDSQTPAEQLALLRAVAQEKLRRKEYAEAIAWAQRYVQSGGAESEVRPLLAQAYLQLGDFANAARELQWEVQTADRAGKPPGEDQLLQLQRCYAQLNDASAYAWALEKLLTHYPRREYWADLLDRTWKRPDFDQFPALDVDLLRLLTGALASASDYIAVALQAQRAGFPGTAKRVVDQGFAKGVLGKRTEGARHREMQRQLAVETLVQHRRISQREVELAAERAKEGTELFDLGFTHVALGDFGKGLAMMEQGVRKGRLVNRQYARLRLGIAYLMAGQKAKAIETFKAVGGRHGAPDLARIWGIYARTTS